MPRPLLVLAIPLLLLAACADDAPPPAANQPPADTAAAAGEWVTLLERTMETKRSTPEPFTARSGSLRVITTLGASTSPYAPGLLIANLLSESSVLPVASVRAEPRQLEAGTTDTTMVEVPAGALEFFVAEHRGLDGWRVQIQEFRPAPG